MTTSRLLPLLLALLVTPIPGHAGPEPLHNDDATTSWIHPAEVPARADALRRRLEAVQSRTEQETNFESIESGLAQLGPDLDILLDQADAVLARSASFVRLDDLRRQITDAAAPLGAWQATVEAASLQLGKAFDEISQEQGIWVETRNRSDTAGADPGVARSVGRSIQALDQAVVDLRARRARVLTLSERLSDRRTAADERIDGLRTRYVEQRANIFVPGGPALWQSGFSAELASVPDEFRSYARGTLAYAESNPRPLVMQALLAVLLMLAFRALAAQARARAQSGSPEDSSHTAELLKCPYAIALLLALMATPLIHPLAPRRFVQVLAIVGLFATARIVIHATGRANIKVFAWLLVILLLDRIALALAPLPAVAGWIFLLYLAIAFALALWLRRHLNSSGDAPWLRRVANLALLGLTLACIASLGGWTDLAVLLGRGITSSAVVALYVYAAVVTLGPVLVYLLRSPMLRRSHLLEHRIATLQPRVERALRWLGVLFWFYLTLRAVGLLGPANEALRNVLGAAVSVGAFSLSIGGVLAFVVTLLAAWLLARIINGVLEEDVYPRTNLPRGIPDAISTLVRYGIFTFGFMMALAGAGVKLSQLSILIGGFGVGVGLGLQDLVKNFAAGLTLLSERRLNVGDVLQIPAQEAFGRVRAIGTRATIVRNWNGTEVIVPNAVLVSSGVTNWTLSDQLSRIDFPVGVAYGTDPDRVVALLLEVARANNRLVASPPPMALFNGFGENSLDFVLRAWTNRQYEQIAILTSELALAVHRSLRENEIGIPFPQRDLHFTSISPELRNTLSGFARDTGDS